MCHPAGRLRVELPAAFGRQRILPLLLNITRSHPELELTVTFSERFVDPIEEGIDLVIRIGELADSRGLVARRLNKTDNQYTLLLCRTILPLLS
nr:LysR substrate-binding domain-containing protein [Dickeya dianthicola]MCA7001985.1 hypothetical protein [Dickeya dianthicola]